MPRPLIDVYCAMRVPPTHGGDKVKTQRTDMNKNLSSKKYGAMPQTFEKTGPCPTILPNPFKFARLRVVSTRTSRLSDIRGFINRILPFRLGVTTTNLFRPRAFHMVD